MMINGHDIPEIAFFENNYCEDGTVKIPKVLQPYMGGKTKLEPVNK